MRKFGLIGDSLKHSFSANYFAAKFEREGITDAVYSLYELPTIEHVKELIAQNPELVGFNVTLPYKQQIIPYLDDMSVEARNIGAVNCVKIKDGRLIGYNADIVGLRDSMQQFLQGVEISHALILGTGGASQAVQYLLSQMQIEFQIVSRDPFRGNLTYQDITAEVMQSVDLIVNTTPLGTFPNVDEAPTLPYAFLSPSNYLFDLIYNPERTQFLDYGVQRGAHVCNGSDMLVGQAVESWRIWNEE